MALSRNQFQGAIRTNIFHALRYLVRLHIPLEIHPVISTACSIQRARWQEIVESQILTMWDMHLAKRPTTPDFTKEDVFEELLSEDSIRLDTEIGLAIQMEPVQVQVEVMRVVRDRVVRDYCVAHGYAASGYPWYNDILRFLRQFKPMGNTPPMTRTEVRARIQEYWDTDNILKNSGPNQGINWTPMQNAAIEALKTQRDSISRMVDAIEKQKLEAP